MSAGGRHILCSPELIEAVDKKNITDEDEGIEVELNASGRPKRKCAGKGVERLEMSINNDKKYTTTNDQNYQLSIKSEYHPLSSGRKSHILQLE